jgi:hypothetical protein
MEIQELIKGLLVKHVSENFLAHINTFRVNQSK